MNVINFIKKIQGLSESQKKIIFFAVMTVATLGMAVFAVSSTVDSFAAMPRADGSLAGSVDFEDLGSLYSEQSESALDANIIPPEDQTQDWKVYTNNQYGFLVKYPPSFLLLDKKSVNKEVTLWQSFADNKNAVSGSSSLDLQVIKSNLLPKAWIIQNFKEGVFMVKDEDIKETLVNGKSAFQFQVTGEKVTYFYTIFTLKDGMLAMMSYHQAHEGAAKYSENMYQQFLSTFALASSEFSQ